MHPRGNPTGSFSLFLRETPCNIAHGELLVEHIRSVARVFPAFLAFSESQEEFIEVFRIDQRLDGHSPIFKTWRVNRKNVGAIRENRSSIV